MSMNMPYQTYRRDLTSDSFTDRKLRRKRQEIAKNKTSNIMARNARK
jgi:hypothetical protein